MIQRFGIRRSVAPCVLGNLLIRVRGSQRLPRTNNVPSPNFSSDEPFSNLDGGNYRFDVKVGGQEIRIDERSIERIRGPQFDRPTCPKIMRDGTRG